MTFPYRLVVVCALVGLPLVESPAAGQIRIVDYNTHDGPNPGMATVFEAIGSDARIGFAKPPDILALQEQISWATTTQGIADVLNSISLFAQQNCEWGI